MCAFRRMYTKLASDFGHILDSGCAALEFPSMVVQRWPHFFCWPRERAGSNERIGVLLTLQILAPFAEARIRLVRARRALICVGRMHLD